MLNALINCRPGMSEKSTQIGPTLGMHRIHDYRALLTEGALWVHDNTA